MLFTACIQCEDEKQPTAPQGKNVDSVIFDPADQQTAIPNYPTHVDLNSIIPTCDYIDKSSPLYGKRIVFTGTLSIERKEAMQMAVNAGALIRTTVSGKTDYLVVGQQDLSIVGEKGQSTKEINALALNSSGKAHINIIDEQEFMALFKTEAVSM